MNSYTDDYSRTNEIRIMFESKFNSVHPMHWRVNGNKRGMAKRTTLAVNQHPASTVQFFFARSVERDRGLFRIHFPANYRRKMLKLHFNVGWRQH